MRSASGTNTAGCRPVTSLRRSRELEADEWQAVSLWEFFEDGKRGGLRVLLAPRDAWIGLPRA